MEKMGIGRHGKAGMGRRCVRACVLVAIGLAAIPLAGSLAPYVMGARAFASLLDAGEGENDITVSDDEYGESGSSTALGSSTASDAFEATDEAARAFGQEVLDLDCMRDVRSNEDCSVVGFSLDGGASDAFSCISADLAQRGWVSVGSGSACIGSFVKETGEYTWLCVNCIGIGDETSVVICAW